MNPSLKIAIGLGTVGGTVGGGIVLHQQLTSTTKDIHNKLISEGYEMLSDNSEHWANILKSYADTVGEAKNIDLKFGTFDGKQAPNNTPEKLREECKEALNSKDVNESNLKKARKWCTVPKILTEILKIKKYRPLSWDTTKDEDGTQWDQKMNKYKSHSQVNEKISGLVLTSVDSPYDKTKRDKLKEKCKGFESKKHYEKDFEEILAKSTLWCAVNNS